MQIILEKEREREREREREKEAVIRSHQTPPPPPILHQQQKKARLTCGKEWNREREWESTGTDREHIAPRRDIRRWASITSRRIIGLSCYISNSTISDIGIVHEHSIHWQLYITLALFNLAHSLAHPFDIISKQSILDPSIYLIWPLHLHWTISTHHKLV